MSTPRHDTWMPLYVADYLSDTTHLHGMEHGAYLLLIMHAWRNSGTIPRDDKRLAKIASLSLAEWKRVKPAVMAFWIDPGVHSEIYMHKRINDELERAQAITEKRSKAGARGAAGRWQTDAPANGKRMANGCDGLWQNDGPSQSHTLPSEEQRARKARLPDGIVDRIWNAAPPKARERSSRKDVERTLAAAIKRGGEPDAITKALNAYWRSEDATKNDAAYAKGIHRMIEGDRWKGWETATAATAQPVDAPVNWEWRMAQFRGPDRVWIESMWGPAPGRDGCLVPAELLEA